MLSGDDDGDASIHTGRVVPIYEAAGKVTTRILRGLLHRKLDQYLTRRRSATPHLLHQLEAAGPLERDSGAPLSARFRPAATEDGFRSAAQFRLIFEENSFGSNAGWSWKRAKARLNPGIAFELNSRVQEQIHPDMPFKPGSPEARAGGNRA